eukprot:363918-Chlamydomonas_euryale.AAC.1
MAQKPYSPPPPPHTHTRADTVTDVFFWARPFIFLVHHLTDCKVPVTCLLMRSHAETHSPWSPYAWGGVPWQTVYVRVGGVQDALCMCGRDPGWA